MADRRKRIEADRPHGFPWSLALYILAVVGLAVFLSWKWNFPGLVPLLVGAMPLLLIRIAWRWKAGD
jgi:hypothetical protein